MCIGIGEVVQMVLLSDKALNKERNNGRNSLDGVLWLAIYLLHLTKEAGWQLGGKFLERKFKRFIFLAAHPFTKKWVRFKKR